MKKDVIPSGILMEARNPRGYGKGFQTAVSALDRLQGERVWVPLVVSLSNHERVLHAQPPRIEAQPLSRRQRGISFSWESALVVGRMGFK